MWTTENQVAHTLHKLDYYDGGYVSRRSQSERRKFHPKLAPFCVLTKGSTLFRRWTLKAKLIITIGYGFADDHINGILGQALASASDPNERKLLAVGPFTNEQDSEVTSRLAETLHIPENKVVVKKMNASDFMRSGMIIEKLNAYFPESGDVFEEVA